MDLLQIKTFIDAMAASDLSEMVAGKDGWTLRLLRDGASPGAAAPAPAAPRTRPRAAAPAEIRSPMAGIVYLRPSPGEADFVAPGSTIAAGAVICVVEAMKTFLQVRAERGGTIAAILVASGEEVELGQPLMRLG
ncbi:acetyl-CoA carboxylase biotin carboxyl carrier protein [Falsiroseomonas ponticola]|uniref:acetyl-CoA carboxylase biotin carboxyl carrier protein n=1 Tax=Falsiroseomonas ponticola TaxID=2786951 RepID=UPI0019335071|nr:biotin/lipoyl-containing protein [Roseomonas ponticola]